jgi:hypothetical protein
LKVADEDRFLYQIGVSFTVLLFTLLFRIAWRNEAKEHVEEVESMRRSAASLRE